LLMMLDRIVDGDESLLSVGETLYGLLANAGEFIVREREGWVAQIAAGSGANLGTIDPMDVINETAFIGDYYLANSTGTYTNVPINLGWHYIEGYYYRQYVPTNDYVINEIVYHNGHIYLCIANIIAAPIEFPYDSFNELDTGLMYTDKQSLSMIAGEYYRLFEPDYSTALIFNIIFDKDHIIQASITTSGELNIISSSWTTTPFISELHLERDGTNRNWLIFKALSTTTDTEIQQSGSALTGLTKVEPERPISSNGILNNPSASVYHINQSSGSFRSGQLRSASQSLYVDDLGEPVLIHPVTDNDAILVHKKYVNEEIAKQRTLVAVFLPNNSFGWVDTDLNVIPLSEPINNGYYYIVGNNSTVEALDVTVQPPNTKWAGNNSALAETFVIPGDQTAHFSSPGRCFMFRTADSAWYSVNYTAATFGTNTEITLAPDPNLPAPTNDYDEIFLYVPWPSYFADKYLPPLATGMLSNDTIISTGQNHLPGPPESGGWVLIETGVESVAERVMVSQNVINHGFTTGQQVRVERGPTYNGENTVSALRFDIDAVEGDLTAKFTVGAVIAFVDSTLAINTYASVVVSSDFNVTLANQTTVTIDQQGGTDPLQTYDTIYYEEVTWKLAQSDDVSTLKTATVLNRSANFFYAVMYGAITMENLPLTTYRVGEVYYLSNTVPGGVQNQPPLSPADLGSWRQGAFEVINYIPVSATHGDFIIKVVDWTALPVIDPTLVGSEFIELTGQTVGPSVNVFDQVYKDATGIWQLAQADDANTLKTGMVKTILTAPSSDAEIVTYGQVNMGTHGFIVGETYYLSDITPGGVVLDAPVAFDNFQQVAFEVIDNNIIKVLDQSIFGISEIGENPLISNRLILADSQIEPGTVYGILTTGNIITVTLIDPVRVTPGLIYELNWRSDIIDTARLIINGNGIDIRDEITGLVTPTVNLIQTELTGAKISIFNDGTNWVLSFIENATPSSGIEKYTVGEDYSIGSNFTERGTIYNVISEISPAPIIIPPEKVVPLNLGAGNAFFQKLSITDNSKLWVKVCSINSYTSGSINIGGLFNGVQVDIQVDFIIGYDTSTWDITLYTHHIKPVDQISLRQPNAGDPVEFWIKFAGTFGSTWDMHFVSSAAGNADKSVFFDNTQPMTMMSGPGGAGGHFFDFLPDSVKGFEKWSSMETTSAGIVIAGYTFRSDTDTPIPSGQMLNFSTSEGHTSDSSVLRLDLFGITVLKPGTVKVTFSGRSGDGRRIQIRIGTNNLTEMLPGNDEFGTLQEVFAVAANEICQMRNPGTGGCNWNRFSMTVEWVG